MPEIKPKRKLFRLVGLLFPLLYSAVDAAATGFGWAATVGVLVLFLVIMITLEYARFRKPGVNTWLFDRFSSFTKEKERGRTSSTTFFLLACLIVVLLFDKGVAIASMLMLVAGDPVAEIVGTRWGRTRLLGKSLEGTLAGFAACIAVTAPLTMAPLRLSLPIIVAGAAAATLAELVVLRLDDNFSIGIAAGLVMTLAQTAVAGAGGIPRLSPPLMPLLSPIRSSATDASLGRSAGEASAGQARRDSYLARARTLLDSADYSGAAAELDQALVEAPGDAEALALQVRAFRALRRYPEARSVARRILDRTPQSPLPYILLGSIAMQEGDTVTARGDLQRAVELDTSSDLAVAQLAQIDLLEGKLDDARRRAVQALALSPDNTNSLRVLLRVTRSVPELISVYRRLVASAPDDSLARAWLEALEASDAPEVNHLTVEGAQTTIPCERDADGRLHVRGAALGRTGLRLLVDTGGSGLVISEGLARSGGLSLREGSQSAGLGGLTQHAHPVILDRLDLGAVRMRAVMATASNLPRGIDGILNPVILAPPGSGLQISISAGRPSLVVQKDSVPPEGARQSAGLTVVTMPYLADGNHVIFKMVLGGSPATALLDTGAATDLVDRTIVTRFPGALVRRAAEDGGLIGFAGLVEDAQTVDKVTLRIAGRDFDTQHLFALDLNSPQFRFQIDLDAVVGINRLGVFDVTINPGRGLLTFRPVS
ncbi:MAG TPA: aspartyl protease family protein [Candidatus Polarisedimenticolia bacterium]|nr:aspartyl protease family protein [Candidatus Polarisedimenticolia bacterium]